MAGDRIVVVHSAHRLELRLHEMRDVGAQGLGIREARHTGEAMTLQVGRNEVDADFMRQWLEQNKGSPLLAGVIVEGGSHAEEDRSTV